MSLRTSQSAIESQKAADAWPPGVGSWAEAVAAVVGAQRVLADSAACAGFSVGGIVPGAVVSPETADNVAAVLSIASSSGLAVIPLRNRTKADWPAPPSRYDVALCLKDLNQVWHYEPDDLTITVEAGMKFGDLQHFLARRGLWLPLDPPGGARASIGGILAANASGPLRIRYGAPRDMVIGMKFATPGGKIIKTGGRVVKNVAGYDLSKLLIGSWGTLGVIVEASFKLFPLPPRRQTFVFSAANVEVFKGLRREILGSPLMPMRMMLLNPAARAIATGAAPGKEPDSSHEIWIELGGSEAVLRRGAQILTSLGDSAGCATGPPREMDEAASGACWERIADPTSWPMEAAPDGAILKVGLPLAASEKFLELAHADAARAEQGLATFAQTGTGVILLGMAPIGQRDCAVSFIARLRTAAAELGGTLTVTSAPPGLKRAVDAWGSPPAALAMMRKLKQALDPAGILSPGRLVGGL